MQHVKEFEKALASFRASLDVSLFVTGSNSTLLSGELATLLTGRTVEFEIFPFSFYEMKQYYELNGMQWSEELFFDISNGVDFRCVLIIRMKHLFTDI